VTRAVFLPLTASVNLYSLLHSRLRKTRYIV